MAPKTIEVIHDYPVAPERLWHVATDWRSFTQAMAKIARFDGLPEEPIAAGQVIRVKVALFGVLPPQSWTMEVLEVDPEAMRVRSHEYGGPVRRWDHSFTVSGTPQGARLRDVVVIDAGFLTGFYAWFGRFVYKSRHRPRQRLLGLET